MPGVLVVVMRKPPNNFAHVAVALVYVFANKCKSLVVECFQGMAMGSITCLGKNTNSGDPLCAPVELLSESPNAPAVRIFVQLICMCGGFGSIGLSDVRLSPPGMFLERNPSELEGGAKSGLNVMVPKFPMGVSVIVLQVAFVQISVVAQSAA